MSTASVHMVAPEHLPALPDDNTRQFGGSNTPMHGIPRFEVVAKKKADGTYEHVEYVDIMIPGDNKTSPRHKVTDRIRAKYRPHYEHWKKTQEMAPSGSPIEMWPILTPSQVHELKARNIFTVEQLAGISDSNLHNIPMGQTLRDQAKTWLKEKETADDIESRRRESQAMQDGMRMMEKQIRDMAAQLAEAKNAQAEKAQAPAPQPTQAEHETAASEFPDVDSDEHHRAVKASLKDLSEIKRAREADPNLEAKRARMAKAREAKAAKRSQEA